jgi:hypothetical protein
LGFIHLFRIKGLSRGSPEGLALGETKPAVVAKEAQKGFPSGGSKKNRNILQNKGLNHTNLLPHSIDPEWHSHHACRFGLWLELLWQARGADEDNIFSFVHELFTPHSLLGKVNLVSVLWRKKGAPESERPAVNPYCYTS